MTRRILSIDGGGIRGIIPLCALIQLEAQTGKPVREHFDFLAGTSTGAIIAGALAQGLSAERCLQLYQEAGPAVFRRDWLLWISSLFSYKYRTAPMRDLLQRYLGDVVLNELPVDVMLTATRVQDGKNWFFVRDCLANAQTTGQLKLNDCITASAAAPTFFEPWDVPGIGPCVDGGVGIAGNPVYQACVEAFYYTTEAYVPAETIVVSLGTGVYPALHHPANLIDWVQFLIGELLDAPSEQQTAVVLRHFTDTHTYRWNPQLPQEIGLDAIERIPDLIKIGQKAAQADLDWAKILAGADTANRVLPKTMAVERNQP